MKLIAKNTIQYADAKGNRIVAKPGSEFDIVDATAKELIASGAATPVKATAEKAK